MRILKEIRLIFVLIAAVLGSAFSNAAERCDSITVSLITCWPGAEVYELCGHEAVRVRGENIDSVWNYGTFDFNAPGFVYRFVKGETDYMLQAFPFHWFVPEYQIAGRKVVEQDLNLTQEEAHAMLARLRNNARPENATYRYNYVKNNCATRIVDDIEASTSSRVIFPDSVKYGSFRREMRAYHKDYPWYQFGIDLALGQGIDLPIKGREEMFVPLEMMEKVEGAHLADGRPLVAQTRVLNEGVPDATLGSTHWSATPTVCCGLFFVMVILVCLWQWRKRCILRWMYCIWFALCGLTGCVLVFLVFVSTHEATSPNLLLIWLNPLQLLFAISVWWPRRLRWLCIAIAWYNIVALGVMLLIWPFQLQSANPAFFLLTGATLAMAISYAINSYNNSYKSSGNTRRNEEVGRRNAGGSRGVGHRAAGRKRTTPTRGRNRS